MSLVKPVIKWAGGKKSILKEIINVINKYDRSGAVFFEPFVGGGSVFMALLHDRIVLNDLNGDLINFYVQIKTNNEELIALLEKHKREHSVEHYYSVRNIDRTAEIDRLSDVQKAARFAYLNRTCYNGLYRVNMKNQFNTPIGRYENREIVFSKEMRELHDYFNRSNVTFRSEDFEKVTQSAKKGDLIYFDPPYDYEYAGFDRYTPGKFGKQDTLRLRDLCNTLRKRGCHVVVSNNDTPFIREIFYDWKFIEITAPRYINCKKERVKVNEVIIYD